MKEKSQKSNMAKPARKKPRTEPPAEDAKAAPKARSARTLLVAALLLSMASLGGGFFLARMAFMQDAATYEPDYVEPGQDGHADEPTDAHGGDHSTVDVAAAPEEDGGHGTDEEAGGVEGLLEFDEILTNINGFNAQGQPTRAFLKLTLVLAYRPDPGAAKLMQERQPFMRDLFNGYARGLTEADVRGMAGLLNVKAELLKRARAAAGNDLPQEILINDLIVQ